MGISFSQELSLAERNSYAKLTFDTSKLKKPEKVREDYGIPSGESIIGYMRNTNLFFKLIGYSIDGIVITTQAIYLPVNGHDTNRFPYDDICKYFIYMEDAKSSVFLANAYNKITLMGSTIFKDNAAGEDLLRFVRAIQSALVQGHPWAAKQRESAIGELLNITRNTMRIKRIPADYTALLNCVDSASPNYCAVKLLQAEDLYRSCDINGYNAFVNRLNEKCREEVLQKKDGFAATLRSDLSNMSLRFENAYLEEAYKNLSTQQYPAALIYPAAYIFIRLNKEKDYKRIETQIRQTYGEGSEQPVEAFRCCYYNLRMTEVYSAIKSGKTFDPEWANWTDSMGLTPLHYAIILKNESYIENLLNNYSWGSENDTEDNASSSIYSYNTLASLRNLSNRRFILEKTSSVISTQLRTRKAVERQLWLVRRKLDLQNTTYSAAYKGLQNARRSASPDNEEQQTRIIEFEEKLENLKQLIPETKDQIHELEGLLSDIDFEIEEQVNSTLAEAADTATDWRNSQDPFLCYLYRLFTEENLLYRVLSDSNAGCRIYAYEKIIFAAPDDIDLDLPFRVADVTQGSAYQNTHKRPPHKETKKTNEPIKRPYGDHWFSHKAHKDIRELTKEYHQLAKKYHPDICNHLRSQEIFQEILNERAEILEQMAK